MYNIMQLALSDLLVCKKSDYDRMKTHCSDTISELEDEVQRLKSEKARLLDRLQLPESERASLAAEENEIAELKRRLDDYEMRYGDAVAENEDLQQEVPVHRVVTSSCLKSRIIISYSIHLPRLRRKYFNVYVH